MTTSSLADERVRHILEGTSLVRFDVVIEIKRKLFQRNHVTLCSPSCGLDECKQHTGWAKLNEATHCNSL